MGLFDRLFRVSRDKIKQPDIHFGRYSDSYKADRKYDEWDKSLDLFEQKQYLSAYTSFFEYLKDDHEENVSYTVEDDKISFELYQGSKKVFGIASKDHVMAEAKVAQSDKPNVGFMRRLLEKNFQLKYSRFALDETEDISIIFNTYTIDGSPFKLYYALKELAINADKLDDLLIDEFDMLHPVEMGHITEIKTEQKEVKYHFIIKEIKKILDRIDNGRLDANQYPSGIAYALLDLSYKLDYLIRPEGYLMETIERIHRKYFAQDGVSSIHINHELRTEFESLLERDKEEFYKEMYRVKATFGITTPINHEQLANFIDAELKNMDWYIENGHRDYALAVPGYITGFCLFNWAPPRPVRELIHLYFEVMEIDFFKSLGFQLDFHDNEKLNKSAIKDEIQNIVKNNVRKFPKFKPNTKKLNFDSKFSFAKSFLLMIRDLDLTKID